MRALFLFLIYMLAQAPYSGMAYEPVANPPEVAFDPTVGTEIKPGLRFTDHKGRSVSIGELTSEKPTILVLGYAECPMLCSMIHNDLALALKETNLQLGRDYHVAVISIDPTETIELSAAKARAFQRRIGNTQSEDAIHFLTGTEKNIRAIADTIGYSYTYDEGAKTYAHASGIVILSPGGAISSYQLGLGYDGQLLQQQIRAAASRRIIEPPSNVLMRCFFYDPKASPYAALSLRALRVGALLTLAVMGIFIWRAARQGARVPE